MFEVKRMYKIIMIIPYFGRFREDFTFWLKSVEYNPSVDFLIFSDCRITAIPKNVTVVNMSFNNFSCLLQNIFDFKLSIDKPYKLCDFRPCYGEALSNYIKNYDFWGYCDVDLVFGDIRKFITDEVLESYDRVFGLGHFCLYRNTVQVNGIYRLSTEPNYKQVFTFSEGCAFDEYWGTSRYWNMCFPDRFYQAYVFDDVDCLKYTFHAQKRKIEDKEKSSFIYEFNRGKLFRVYEQDGVLHKDETMYVHFQKRKMRLEVDPAECFLMVPNRFIPYEELSLERCRELRGKEKCYSTYYKIQWDRVKGKWRKMRAALKDCPYGVPKLPSDAGQYYVEEIN